MAMGRERRIKLLMAVVLLLTLAKGSNCNKTCTVADLELLQFQVDKHGDRTPDHHMNPAGGAGGRKLKQMPMSTEVWVYNHCPCMVDNVVIYAPGGFSTIDANETDGRVFSKAREHLYLINDAGPLQPSASCSLPPSPLEASVKKNTSAGGPLDASVKDYICPSASFWYTWYDEIELKPAFLVPHC
ncbi:hypothetical protein TRIUR3_04541 [Triticum urartu]|uniref:Uncharacterized protein n=2 Tax=Triticum urartu TaxID=4572 RepID=M7ZHY3_TRIUA|nr:hypothetical protein TRIUR3_04541 [Triticum urartu]